MYLQQGFLVPAAAVTLILVSLVVRGFAAVRILVLSVLTLAWLAFLSLLASVVWLGTSGKEFNLSTQS